MMFSEAVELPDHDQIAASETCQFLGQGGAIYWCTRNPLLAINLTLTQCLPLRVEILVALRTREASHKRRVTSMGRRAIVRRSSACGLRGQPWECLHSWSSAPGA